MFVNRMPRYEILSEEAMATLDRGWRRIVSEIGVEFILPEAVEVFAAAGQKTEDAKVWLDPDFVMEQVGKAPQEFDLQARNPEHSVRVVGLPPARLGGRDDLRAQRRPARLAPPRHGAGAPDAHG